MKSYIRTIIVLVLFGLLMASAVPAQETPGETATAGNLQPAAAAPSPSAEPSPSPSGAAFPGEVDVATSFELAEEPSGDTVSYIAVEPPPLGETINYVNLSRLPTAGSSSSSSRKVLVIPNTEIKAEDLVSITQDLQVMAHIFHKIFTGPRLIEGIFMDYGDFFGRGSRATEAVYLQGYGALFLMEVNIPLSSPPKAKEQEKDESATKADSVWKQARQEIFQPSPYRNPRVQNSGEIYDAEKVEELKSRLIKALKHAANMKNLEPDEMIILTVIGKGPSYPVDVYGGYYSGRSEYASGFALEATRSYNRSGRSSRNAGIDSTTRGGTGGASSTVLTIRAKKSDIDAFAKGDLDYDKFREKVQILTYPSLGQNMVRARRTTRTPYRTRVPTMGDEPIKLR